MQQKLWRVFLLVLLTSLLATAGKAGMALSAVSTASSQSPAFLPGELLIKFASLGVSHAEQETARQKLQDYQAERLETIAPLSIEHWRVPEGQELAIAAALNRLPGIAYAEPNYKVHMLVTPNDPRYGEQWAHPMIGSPAAWDVTTGSAAVTIAILDTGVDLDHPEFVGRIVPGYDYANNDTNPDDDQGHGTHVAGIAAAAGNNGTGGAGMAWQVRIMPIKVLNAQGGGSHSGIANGIAWAVEHGARVINLSLGGVVSTSTLQNAVQYAVNNGALVVAAAGNCGDAFYEDNNCDFMNQPVYPGAYGEALAVAATTSSDGIASYSNQGSYIDVAAPGSGILSTYLGGFYSTKNGTSQATPFVSGLAALLWSVNPSLTAGEIEQIIESTAVDRGAPGFDFDFGNGRINAGSAVSSITGLDAPMLNPISNADRDGSYSVTWSSVSQATQYLLEEDDDPYFASPHTVYNGSLTLAALIGRQSGTWYYRVRAADPSTGRTSAWSNTVSVRVGLDAPVLYPIYNDGQKAYLVSWQSVEGAAEYRLQEADNPSFAPAATHTVTGTSYSVSERPGGTWYYRVQAYGIGELATSPWSEVQSVMVVPDAPASLTLIPSTDPDTYTLSWSAVMAATGYRLVETAGLTGTEKLRYEGTQTTYQVTGQPGGRWVYTARAYNLAGEGQPSVSREITVTASLVLAPEMLPIDNEDRDGSYIVRWTPVPSATLYTLEESRTPWFEAPTFSYTTTMTGYVTLDQSIGRWQYRVRSHIDADRSPWSASVWALYPSLSYLPVVMRQSG